MNFYPIKFVPILKERIWGGTKLKTELRKSIDKDTNIGESWELSTVEGNVSVVANGALAGKLLSNLLTQYPTALLGKKVVQKFGTNFPILIKFIDAKKDLSVQLHPNDTLAKKRHNSFGKTEMWYVMQPTDEAAKLIIGFNKDISKKEYLQSIKEDTLLDLLHYETVKEGDVFFIHPGKIHAIGAGVLLAEIQQTSDITYRVYDFNRKDKNGNYRKLHIEETLDAVDYAKKEDFKISYNKKIKNQSEKIVESNSFKTKILHLDKNYKANISEVNSFIIYICVKGNAILQNENGNTTVKKGETVLISANSKHLQIITSDAKFLEVTI